MPTLSAVRVNPWLRAYYQRVRAVGKPAKVALAAAMRKLMAAAYSVARPSPAIHAGACFFAGREPRGQPWRLASRKLYASVTGAFSTGAHGIRFMAMFDADGARQAGSGSIAPPLWNH